MIFPYHFRHSSYHACYSKVTNIVSHSHFCWNGQGEKAFDCHRPVIFCCQVKWSTPLVIRDFIITYITMILYNFRDLHRLIFRPFFPSPYIYGDV